MYGISTHVLLNTWVKNQHGLSVSNMFHYMYAPEIYIYIHPKLTFSYEIILLFTTKLRIVDVKIWCVKCN